MNKVAHYLQQHLSGEVLVSQDVLSHFSHDESIFQIQPLLVAHPRTENDLRKAARFSWQLSERGRIVPITIRGKGGDQTGASIGSGVILSTPAHMNKIIELDPKSGSTTVQSGISIDKLQQTLHTHGLYLPPVHEANEYATIGGSVANNDAGPNSYKYGPIREYVTGTRTVLANGELIRTERLTKRELNKKLGLSSFEGEIYRSLDTLIEDSKDVLESLRAISDRSNAGYSLDMVKAKDGSFDITPLLVGSQGTLGLISEVTLATETHTPQVEMLVAAFSSHEEAFSAVAQINQLKQSPSAIDFIDSSIIGFVQSLNPNLYKKSFGSDTPEICLFMTLEETAGKFGKRSKKQLLKLLDQTEATVVMVEDKDREAWEAARDSPAVFTASSKGSAKPLPLVSDAYIPIENCAAFIAKAKVLLAKYSQHPFGIWGQAGSGIIYAMPMFDIAAIGDRQKLFKLLDEYYTLVAEMGGSVSARSAEGRLHASQTHKVLSQEIVQLMISVKKIFDPYGTLNPGVKLPGDVDKLKPLTRNVYSLDHQHSHIVSG